MLHHLFKMFHSIVCSVGNLDWSVHLSVECVRMLLCTPIRYMLAHGFATQIATIRNILTRQALAQHSRPIPFEPE